MEFVYRPELKKEWSVIVLLFFAYIYHVSLFIISTLSNERFKQDDYIDSSIISRQTTWPNSNGSVLIHRTLHKQTNSVSPSRPMLRGMYIRIRPPPYRRGKRTATNKLYTFGKGLVAQYVLDELVGNKVQMSHSGGLKLSGADVRRGHVSVAKLHLFVRHDVMQMLSDAFHDS